MGLPREKRSLIKGGVVKNVIKTIRVQLKPNNKQNTKLFASAGVGRFAYNWALSTQQANYENGGKFIQDGELRRRFTELKQTEEYLWLNDYSNNITKQAIKDACNAYKNFFDKKADFPKYKSRKRTKPSFYIDPIKIKFTNTHVKLEKLTCSRKQNRQKLNWVRLCEKDRVPVDVKYYNPRVSFDGLHWWLTVGIEMPVNAKAPSNEPIGIDLGIEKLAVTSNNDVFENINKTKEVRRLKKKKRRLQRKISRKYEQNKGGEGRYRKTNNIIKSEILLKKLYKRLTNIRNNHLHQTTSSITKREPSFIVLEDLCVSGMMKNRHLAKAIQEQKFYEFHRQIKYKSYWNGIEVIIAPRFLPSSKTCSNCGSYKKDLKLQHRTFVCDECGFKEDRDLNASLNLLHYGQSVR